MRALAALILSISMLATAAGDLVVTEAEVAPRIRALSYESSALKQKKALCAVLPEAFEKEKGPWPVLFLLHGRGRTERSLVDDPGARDALLAAPFVTILPDGDDGWYINSPAKPEDRYQDYIDEVIALATNRFNLSTDPEKRGLSGWSMGGYGCTRYAIDRPGRFGALAPIIGLLDFPRDGLPEGQSYKVPADRFGEDRETWAALNPLNQAEALRGMELCLITGTTAFDRTMNVNFSQRITELGIPHTWRLVEGGHTFDVVRDTIPVVVSFMDQALAPR
jgi:S-formylglutathione hydrolase FrmB